MHPIGSRHPSPTFSTNQVSTIERRVNARQQIFLDRLTSQDVQRELKIPGCEQGTKSTLAMALGFPPFFAVRAGELVVQICANAAISVEEISKGLGVIAQPLSTAVRMSLGIPILIAGACLFAGATLFSKTQQLVWGKYLVGSPLEKRFHPLLSVYGYGDRPWSDFRKLVNTFFSLSFNQETNANLNYWKDFKVT